MPPKMTHFVAFRTARGGGWTTISLPQGFRGQDEIAAVQAQLREASGDQTLTITGWQRLEV